MSEDEVNATPFKKRRAPKAETKALARAANAVPPSPGKAAAFLADFSATSGASALFNQKAAVETFALAAGQAAPLKLYVHSGALSRGAQCFALACLFEDVWRGGVEAVFVLHRGCFAPDDHTAARVLRSLKGAGATIHEVVAALDAGPVPRRSGAVSP